MLSRRGIELVDLKLRVAFLAALLFFAGCAMRVKHSGYGTWDSSVEELGPVSVCRGGFCEGTDEGSQWALSLTNPPSEDTYHTELITKASKVYNVPKDEIVLKEIDVDIYAEIVGTVRGWKATSIAGRKTGPEPLAAPRQTSEQRLEELRELQDKGLITPEEYEQKRNRIIDQL